MDKSSITAREWHVRKALPEDLPMIAEIEKLSFENLVILYEDNISDELKNKNLKVYKKPLNHENLISL
jgi:hypothetical protein